MFLITYRLMHRQLQDMVEAPKVAEIPSTEEGIYCGKLLILFYFIRALYSIEFYRWQMRWMINNSQFKVWVNLAFLIEHIQTYHKFKGIAPVIYLYIVATWYAVKVKSASAKVSHLARTYSDVLWVASC